MCPLAGQGCDPHLGAGRRLFPLQTPGDSPLLRHHQVTHDSPLPNSTPVFVLLKCVHTVVLEQDHKISPWKCGVVASTICGVIPFHSVPSLQPSISDPGIRPLKASRTLEYFGSVH